MHQCAGRMTEPDRFLLLPSLPPMRLWGFPYWLVFSQSPSYPGIRGAKLVCWGAYAILLPLWASDIFTPGFKEQIPFVWRFLALTWIGPNLDSCPLCWSSHLQYGQVPCFPLILGTRTSIALLLLLDPS
jgi:hypothetical protein